MRSSVIFSEPLGYKRKRVIAHRRDVRFGYRILWLLGDRDRENRKPSPLANWFLFLQKVAANVIHAQQSRSSAFSLQL